MSVRSGLRVALLAAWLAVGAVGCRHVPPDKEARAVQPVEVVRRTPAARELDGAWISQALRGPLAEIGGTAVYVFGPDGAYTGALVSNAECVPIAGSWTYDAEAGRLDLDDGALAFDAQLVDNELELTGSDSFLRLVRFIY